jgi:hypothetical protein
MLGAFSREDTPMRWVVEAVDSRTGLDTEMTVEALTATEAERLARYNGLLVADVYKHGFVRRFRRVPPVMPYAPPRSLEPGPPAYAQVLRDARWVRRLGQGIAAVGWVGVFGAAAWYAYLATRAGAHHWKDWRAWLVAPALVPWKYALAGAALVIVGSVLRLLGATALALRDTARNTFRAPAGEPVPDPAPAPAGAPQV